MHDHIGGYESITLLAESLTGRVHLAQSPGSGQLFAIKEMILEDDSALSVQEQHQRFEREVRIHCALDHPNIVKAHGGGVHEGRPYLVLDYQPGTTLQAIMEAGRPPMPQVIEWGIQLCSALEYLYDEKQLVHRDIKPSNLIISPSGQVKMTDFGLARVALHPEITQTKMMLGTIVYMSPEQLLDPTLVDNRADIFAVGAVLFKALTGSLPFAAEDLSGMAHRLLYDQPTDPREFNPQIPSRLAKIVLGCLAKDVDSRYTTARALANDLEAALADPQLYLGQGRIYAESGQWQDAVHSFQQAAAKNGENGAAWFALGDALEHLGQAEPAFDCFLKAINADPSAAEAYRRLGHAYRKRNDPSAQLAALKMIERAWTLDPEDTQTCLDLVSLRRAAGLHHEALELAAEVVRRFPGNARAHLDCGRILYDRGHLEEALAAFRCAIKLAPNEFDCLFNLAALLLEQEQPVEAEELLLRAISVKPDRVEAKHNLALLWFKQGRLDEAEGLARNIVTTEPSGAGYTLLGKVLLAADRPLEAVSAFEAAAAEDPAWDILASLAEALARSFRYQAALDVLERARQTAPESERAPLAYLYGHMAAASGSTHAAAEAMQICLDCQPEPALAQAAKDLLGRLIPRRSLADLSAKRAGRALKGLLRLAVGS